MDLLSTEIRDYLSHNDHNIELRPEGHDNKFQTEGHNNDLCPKGEGSEAAEAKWCEVPAPGMRRGSIAMEDSLSEVVPREFLVCPLCREEYQDPKYLPCLHSFCKACIDEHIEATGDRTTLTFLCPVCATSTPVPEVGEDEEGDALPDNTFARRLSCPAVVQGQRDRACGQCQSGSGVRTEASIHCINCDEFLCGQCSLTHLEQEETASHKTQPISQYAAENEDVDGGGGANGTGGATDPASLYHALDRCCPLYDALDIGALFCVDCELSVCSECHAREHNEHKCAEISALAANFENKIKEPLRELKKDQHKLHKALNALENARTYTARKQHEVKREVRKRVQTLCRYMEEYERVLGLELDKKHHDNLAQIQERQDAIKRHLASIQAVTDLTDKLLTFGSEEEKVAMRRKIGRRVRELCEEELPSKRVTLTKVRLSEPSVSVETVCSMFGELQTETLTNGRNGDRNSSTKSNIDPSTLNLSSTNNSNSNSQRRGTDSGIGRKDKHKNISKMHESHSVDLGMISRGKNVSSKSSISSNQTSAVSHTNVSGSSTRSAMTAALSLRAGRQTMSVSAIDDGGHELADLEELEEEEEDVAHGNNDDEDMLSSSNTSDVLHSLSRTNSNSTTYSTSGNSLDLRLSGMSGTMSSAMSDVVSPRHHEVLESSSPRAEQLTEEHHGSHYQQQQQMAQPDYHYDKSQAHHHHHHQHHHHHHHHHQQQGDSDAEGHLRVPGDGGIDSSFQSQGSSVGTLEDVPCFNLEEVKRELILPDSIAKDSIKGVGINHSGDIIVGTVSPGGVSRVYILEKHGIVRGQIDVEKNWSLHAIGADGKVSLVMPRSENRYKVRVLSGANSIDVLADANIENFGLNFVTASKTGTLLVSGSRYAALNPAYGRSAKSGGNVTLYDPKGGVECVVANESIGQSAPDGAPLYLLDRPNYIAVDGEGNFFVADPGTHSVMGFKPDGELVFEYGNTDVEEELYQGPDSICIDIAHHGRLLVLDKKDARIDVLSYTGQLLKCYFPSEHVRFVSVTPDKMILVVTSEGEMKFYDYKD